MNLIFFTHQLITVLFSTLLLTGVTRNLSQSLFASSTTTLITTGIHRILHRDTTHAPAPSESEENFDPPQSRKIIIYWDFQNIFIKNIADIQAIIDFIRQQGEIISAHVYADWSKVPVPIARKFAELKFVQTQISDPDENALDWVLTHQCLEYIASSPQTSDVFIIAGDADYGYLGTDQLRRDMLKPCGA
jgi:hypothetical protein